MNNQSKHLRSLRDLFFHATTFMTILCNKHKKIIHFLWVTHLYETKKMHKLLNDENAPIKNSRILISKKKSFDSPVEIYIHGVCGTFKYL